MYNLEQENISYGDRKMQECLGISIADKVIRYAKVQKDSNNFKISSYGLKFFSNLEETINQIIEETNSTKISISTNITNEKYYYFNIFSLINKNYAEKAIKTEFESFCNENHINGQLYEGKYIYTKSLDNPDQSRIIYIYDKQEDIAEKASYFKKGRLDTLSPLPIVISNLISTERNKNSMIIDLEEKTTITTIINQNIYNVETIEQGMNEILEKINEKENSYSKSYEVCKNSTIYTMETDEYNTGNNEYLKYIIPTLYNITQEVQRIQESVKHIDNIYITGMGAVINNIDLYFKEYFKDAKVEILKPSILSDKSNINIKDYIEVNSAIALALQGLGEGIKEVNFIKGNFKENFKGILTSDISTLKFKLPKIDFKSSFQGKTDKVERILIRNIIIVLITAIIYAIGSTTIFRQIKNKISETEDVISYTNSQWTLADKDDREIIEKTKDYQKYKLNLENVSSAIETRRSRKNQITTLLNKIVYNIPKEVILTEIKNTEVTTSNSTVQHITIYAQAEKYEQLAYFKAKLKNANILDNITSSDGQKDGNTVRITIEGDLKTY